MHVEVHGDGRAPHLLLAHGICSSRAQWRPNLAALANVATPVVVELLGHGRSASPEDPDAYTVAAYIARFEAIRAELGAERWAVCGQSFGAGLTMNYALAHPERVSAQVFTNSNSALREPLPTLGPEQLATRAAAIEARGRGAIEAMPFFPKRTGRLAPGGRGRAGKRRRADLPRRNGARHDLHERRPLGAGPYGGYRDADAPD